jgi:hypothetical protein
MAPITAAYCAKIIHRFIIFVHSKTYRQSSMLSHRQNSHASSGWKHTSRREAGSRERINSFKNVPVDRDLPRVLSAGWLDIDFTVGTSYERAVWLAEKNAAARHHVLRSLISLRRHFSRQVAELFRRKFRRLNECQINLLSEHPLEGGGHGSLKVLSRHHVGESE